MTLSNTASRNSARSRYYQLYRYSSYCGFYISTSLVRILLIGCCLITLTASRDLAQERIGCDSSDHQACDELCKQDSYWYGHCSTWDGRDFSCTCYQYKEPLNGSICNQMQRICKDYCERQGLEGGYCYVHASLTAPNGTTDCKCFEELLPPNR